MSRYRAMSKVMPHILERDPETGLTPWAVRQLVLTGVIPSVRVGRKRLVDLDTLDQYLVSTPKPPTAQSESRGVIRPISIIK